MCQSWCMCWHWRLEAQLPPFGLVATFHYVMFNICYNSDGLVPVLRAHGPAALVRATWWWSSRSSAMVAGRQPWPPMRALLNSWFGARGLSCVGLPPCDVGGGAVQPRLQPCLKS